MLGKQFSEYYMRDTVNAFIAFLGQDTKAEEKILAAADAKAKSGIYCFEITLESE